MKAYLHLQCHNPYASNTIVIETWYTQKQKSLIFL